MFHKQVDAKESETNERASVRFLFPVSMCAYYSAQSKSVGARLSDKSRGAIKSVLIILNKLDSNACALSVAR